MTDKQDPVLGTGASLLTPSGYQVRPQGRVKDLQSASAASRALDDREMPILHTFKNFAFKTHPMAYLDGGLGDLPISDLMKVAAQPNIQEWGDMRTWDQAVDSGKVVLPNKANFYMEAVGKALSRLLAK